MLIYSTLHLFNDRFSSESLHHSSSKKARARMQRSICYRVAGISSKESQGKPCDDCHSVLEIDTNYRNSKEERSIHFRRHICLSNARLLSSRDCLTNRIQSRSATICLACQQFLFEVEKDASRERSLQMHEDALTSVLRLLLTPSHPRKSKVDGLIGNVVSLHLLI